MSVRIRRLILPALVAGLLLVLALPGVAHAAAASGRVHASDLTSDAYESDDDSATAPFLPEVTFHNTGYTGDPRLFRVHATPPATPFLVETAPGDGMFYAMKSAYDESGNIVAGSFGLWAATRSSSARCTSRRRIPRLPHPRRGRLRRLHALQHQGPRAARVGSHPVRHGGRDLEDDVAKCRQPVRRSVIRDPTNFSRLAPEAASRERNSFADALAAPRPGAMDPFAGPARIPLLLTAQNHLEPQTRAEIIRCRGRRMTQLPSRCTWRRAAAVSSTVFAEIQPSTNAYGERSRSPGRAARRSQPVRDRGGGSRTRSSAG